MNYHKLILNVQIQDTDSLRTNKEVNELYGKLKEHNFTLKNGRLIVDYDYEPYYDESGRLRLKTKIKPFSQWIEMNFQRQVLSQNIEERVYGEKFYSKDKLILLFEKSEECVYAKLKWGSM